MQEALLMTVERRQEEEMDLLMGLLEGARTQQQLVNIAQGKEDQVECEPFSFSIYVIRHKVAFHQGLHCI